MKLIVPKVFSQRDPEWASDLLGYNSDPAYSVGQFGCLITCFAMYVDKTPREVNELLKANNGYTSGSGNFIWNKCSVLGLTQVYQSPKYTDAVTDAGITKMQSLLDNGSPLICHVDFDPRDPDDDQHWVFVYGYEGENFFIADPWTGTLITMDVYGGVRRAVIEWRTYDRILAKDVGIDPLRDCLDHRDSHWNDLMTIKNKLGIVGEYSLNLILGEIDKFIGYEDKIIKQDRLLTSQNDQIRDIQKRADDLATEVQNLSTANTEAKKTIEAQGIENEQMKIEINNQKIKIDQLEAKIDDFTKRIPLLSAGGVSLIIEGIKRLFKGG